MTTKEDDRQTLARRLLVFDDAAYRPAEPGPALRLALKVLDDLKSMEQNRPWKGKLVVVDDHGFSSDSWAMTIAYVMPLKVEVRTGDGRSLPRVTIADDDGLNKIEPSLGRIVAGSGSDKPVPFADADVAVAAFADRDAIASVRVLDNLGTEGPPSLADFIGFPLSLARVARGPVVDRRFDIDLISPPYAVELRRLDGSWTLHTLTPATP